MFLDFLFLVFFISCSLIQTKQYVWEEESNKLNMDNKKIKQTLAYFEKSMLNHTNKLNELTELELLLEKSRIKSLERKRLVLKRNNLLEDLSHDHEHFLHDRSQKIYEINR